jgi:hypothetical protein
MGKRLENGEKNRWNPNKAANLRRGTDVDECRLGCPWCRDCHGTLEDTFKCMSRANHWLASLSDKERKKALELYEDSFFAILYR